MRRKATIFLSVGLLCAGSAHLAAETSSSPQETQSQQSVEAACAQSPCRKGGFQIGLKVGASGGYLAIPVTHSPYVLPDGSLLIFPGETLAFQFMPAGDALGTPRFEQAFKPEFPSPIHDDRVPAVSEAEDLPPLPGKLPKETLAALPPGTLVVSYGQFSGQTGMVLNLMNGIARTIKLDAIVAEISSRGYKQHQASTCPLMPNMVDMESWAEPLGPVMLRNFRFLPQQPATNGSAISVTCD